jgi:hypothetical protein
MALVELDPLLKTCTARSAILSSGAAATGGRSSLGRLKKKPKSRKAQKAIKERNARQGKLLDDAHIYARTVLTDPEKKAYFQKKARRKKLSAYQLAFGDYFKTLKQENNQNLSQK